MTNDVANRTDSLPAYLQGKSKTEKFGNIDSTDLVIPRVKLLHAVSTEVTDFENAKSGEFWHTVLQKSLGKNLIGVPIVVKKTYVLWPPRGDERGILARSRDGIHWDPPEGEFDIQYPGNKTVYKWRLAPTVAESGLDKFGSSRSDDITSPPAAALTYEILWWFPELRGEMGPAIILNARGSVKVCQGLLSKIDAKPVDHFYQLYSIGSVVAKGPVNTNYFNYSYTSLGYVDEGDAEKASALYYRFKDVAFRASDERDDSSDNGGPGAARHPLQTANRAPDSKF